MQVVHYKYPVSVSDVWLLSLFRAGPGTWVLRTLRERRREGKKALLQRQQQQPSVQQAKQEDGGSAAGGSGGSGGESSSPIRRRLTWTAAFMVFKTWLSFLALFGKSSVFRAWDQPGPRGAWYACANGRSLAFACKTDSHHFHNRTCM